MNPSFWRQRWEKKEIGFHEGKPNSLLVKHFHELSVAKGRRIFVPLCGKTLDISWLLSHGSRVAGVELSQLAIEQLFIELGMQPEITTVGNVEQWSANNLDIFVGDIFAVSGKMLGPVDAVYDRAALVAFPEDMRKRYTAHLSLMDGPPFSVSNEEVHRHYATTYDLTLIAGAEVAGGLKGKAPVKENVWLLKRR